MKRSFVVCSIAGLMVCASAYSVSFDMLTCSPGEDTSRQARFAWNSDSDSCILFCAKPGDPANDHTVLPYVKQYRPVTFSDKDSGFAYYRYSASIDNLEPDTEYIYWLESGGEASERQRFRTSGTKITWNFLWMGGIHPAGQTSSFDGVDLVLFSGDGVDCGAHYEDWRQWNGSPAVTNCMFAAVPGDAEYSDGTGPVGYDWYRVVRNNPRNGPDATSQEACYWFIRGGVLFVGIDSVIHKGSQMSMYDKADEVLTAQTNWFDRVVASQSGRFRYLVVFQHDSFQDAWRSVFDKHKVDLELSGEGQSRVEVRPDYIRVGDSKPIAPKDRGWGIEIIGQKAYKRYRFAVDAPRSDVRCMQLSEIQLLDANGDRISSGYTLDWDSATKNSENNTYPSGERPGLAADGSLDTKWLDWRAGLKESAETRTAAWLEFQFDNPTQIYGYRWYTANDAASRDPVSWTLSAFDDVGGTWRILDKVTSYDPPGNRKTLAYEYFVEPDDPEDPEEPEEPVEPESSIEATTAGGTYYALCVGVNKFKDDWCGYLLGGPIIDVDGVLSACTNFMHGLWRPENCYRLCDSEANRQAVRDQFQALAKVAKSGDTVLYYQASHGGEDCLCLYDGLYYETEFAEDLALFKSGVRVVVVLDACHSGSMFRKGMRGAAEESKSWGFAERVMAYMEEMKASRAKTKGRAKAIAYSSADVGWITCVDYDQTGLTTNFGAIFSEPFIAAWKSSDTDLNGDGYNDFKEMFNIGAPKQAIMCTGVDIRAPQTCNEDVLRSVAGWQVRGRPYTWDGTDWVLETSETPSYTGTWTRDVAYGADGKADVRGDNAFTPYSASTGNVVTVEVKTVLKGVELDLAGNQESDVQAAVCLSTNGAFQVWAGTGSAGVSPTWLEVAADGVTPVSGEEYTLRFTVNYTSKRYSVEVKDADEWKALTTPNSQLPTSSFPLAYVTNRVAEVSFSGATKFTSLFGNSVVVEGFVEDEEIVLDNASVILSAAQAAWLNNCSGGREEIADALTRIPNAEIFNDAYLLNFDITEGEFDYTFEITDVKVLSDSVKVEVALVRYGETNGPINGTVKFYGAETLAAFKSGTATPLVSKTLVDDDFSDGETTTATFDKDGNVFFDAKIEEK